MIDSLLGRLSGGASLSQDEMSGAIDEIMGGHWSDSQIAMLLTALHHKGETVDEVAGAAAALRRHMTPVRSSRAGVIDTCGTGGDASGTFNISTAAALVTAAVGVPVAKHGNRRATSRTGSADVLAALGVNIDADVPTVEACLDELGICFCFAPLMHGAMKHVADVRRRLGIPTIFNLLGPLANPASAPYQLIGVGRAEIRPLIAEALARLGTTRAAVVHGEDGLDEVTLAGRTWVSIATAGRSQATTWRPEDFALPQAPLESLRVQGPEQSAEMITRILAGEPGPPRNIVVLNAAAAMWVAEFSASQPACAQAAAAAIDSGAAQDLLRRLIERTQRAAG